MEPATAREAAERNAQAVVAGNLSRVMADITPEALTQMMQMGAAAGRLSPATMPSIQDYTVAEAGGSEGAEVFHVTFTSAIGKATVAETWKPVMGQWKLAGIAIVSVEPSPGETA